MTQLSRHLLEKLWEDGDLVLFRSVLGDEAAPVLVLAPASEQPAAGIIVRLEHAYALREELGLSSVARPLELVHHRGLPALLLEDPGGELLARLVGHPLELPQFLRVAISIAAALGQLHARGLIHRDVNPANILVDPGTGQTWLIGISFVSRLPRGQVPASLEEIAGTLAYIAPEQTGRMNRSIDARSDLYSFGVTLYEMLTGTLPFRATDPMEWVHCHIARQPMPPHERLKEIPEQISAIIMKLLSKTAEKRYQTAVGLEADLQICLAAWDTQGRIDPFPLGAHDISDRLLIPEKLYGRDQQCKELLRAFDRVRASGTPELVLVSGYPGIGKSSVLHELYKHLVPRRALFSSGKFDQYKRDIPYATLGQAFQTLIHQILSKSDAEVSRWRDSLREAVGPNGQLIVNLISELEFVIGKQPPVPDLAPQEAQNRFQMVFRRFLGAFARPEDPLALFLDDLQWTDAATLELLEHLMTEPETRHLLLVGTYRDNEVGPSHPLKRTIDAIRKAGANIQKIALTPLGLNDVSKLVADSLRCERISAQPLAKLVYEKTGGNPLFAIQFFTALAEEGLLVFDSGRAAWTWDVARIRAKEYTDNLVDFMAGKLSSLTHRTQEALGQLACLGNVAELATLSLVREETEEQTQAVLWEAIRAGLVFRLDSAYTFLHDRVQEAAYLLIPDNERTAVHLRIGRMFASRASPEEMEEKIFEIVNQFNRGSVLIDTLDERGRVAELNLIAGNRAKASTAYTSALTYLVAGRALLAEDCWQGRYALTFALEFQRAECEFLTGNFAAAEERLAMLSHCAANLVDSAAVARLQTELYASLDQSDRAVEAGLEYLRRVGVGWSLHPTDDEVGQEYERIWRQLGTQPIEALIDLLPMADQICQATLDVLTALEEPAYFTDQNLRCLVIARMVNLSLERGNSDGSCVAYVQLGWFVGPRFGDYQAGFRFGKLGLDLMEKRGLVRFRARVSQCFAYFINPWSRHLRTSLELLRPSFITAQEAGDLKYAVYSCDRLITVLLAAGDPLGDVEREAERGLEFARKAKFGYIVDIIIGQLRFIRALRGLTPGFPSFSDADFDEDLFEKHLGGNPHSVFATCWYWIRKLQACFYAGDYPSALTAAAKAEPLLLMGSRHFESAEYFFYDALARAGQYDSASSEEQPRHFEALVGHHKQIAVLAESCPENFGSCAALVAAEIARIEGRELDAERHYEMAIQSAREHGFVQHEAVAHETAARFYSGRGLETIARAYLQNARLLYLRWGALGKVKHLELRYPGLRELPRSPTEGAHGGALEQVDMLALAKAAQAVSSELNLDKLIETLLVIALKNAGAQRGVLILLRAGEPQIAAEAVTGHDAATVNFRQGFPTAAELPDSILRYVIRTQESIILDDASAPNQFSADQYIQKKRARSVLCLPLVKQTSLKGALYLENNLASHVFTPDRISVLRLLVSQAAISLDHARLVTELTQENNERKKAEAALRISEERWRKLFENSSAGILLASPDGHIIAANLACQHMLGYTEEELQSFTVAQLTDERDRAATEAWIVECSEGKRRDWRVEKRYRRKEGNVIWADISVGYVPSTPEGAPAFLMSVIVDITERKRAEKELYQKEVSLREAQTELAHVSRVTTMGELGASIAHEVNQPLAGVVTNANAGLRWLASEVPNLNEAREAFRRILRDGNRAGDVMSRMRALFKKARAAKERVNINEAIDEVVILTQSEVRRNRVLLRTEPAADLPPIIGDRVQLQQVVVNLILNAIEAMSAVEERERDLVIRTERGEADEVRVAVQDSGTGLDPSSIDRIFDAFHTTKPGGLGMGLSISRSIVESHGGRLWAVSNDGPGATFHFTLPNPRDSHAEQE
jgi:PAS domain S-box-containing protein